MELSVLHNTIYFKEAGMRGTRRLFRTCIIFLTSALVMGACAQFIPKNARVVNTLNRGWTFIKQDVAAATGTGTADPAGWVNVNLPHSFDTPYWRAGVAQGSQVGWYRRHLNVDPAVITAKRRVFIEFEAAFQYAQVYVNGSLMGTHSGGYTGFSVDLTSKIQAGDNVIAVRLDARWADTIAPRSGEHVFIGGIYRNVSVVYTDPVHVTWYGTFITTPTVSVASPASATVRIKTEIRNDGSAAGDYTLQSIITDSSGNQVGTTLSSPVSLAAGATATFVQTSSALSNVRLWSPSTPYIYKVHTEIYKGTDLIDNFESTFGIRSVRWTTTDGFQLNGQRLWLQGANVHQDHAGWGDAAASTGQYRDVKLIRDCGMNFIRGSHYPKAPAFADACDRLGVCFLSEMCYWGLQYGSSKIWNDGAYSPSPAFKQNVLDQTREMIRIHRNHPSIIIWSMGNELWFTNDINGTVTLLGQMVAVARTEDSTRQICVGGTQVNTAQLSGPVDVSGFNGGWVNAADINGSLSKPTLVAEYGSCYDGATAYNACWGDNITTPPSHTQYGWRAGGAYWCAFDHGSNINTGTMGMINNARIPGKRYYFYQNLYLGTPAPVWPASGTASKLKIKIDRDTLTDDGKTDVQVLIQVQNSSGQWLTNSPAITVTDLAGLGAFPTGSPTGTSITFTANTLEGGVSNGQAAIEYRSYKAGTTVLKATSSGLAADSVTIVIKAVPDHPQIPVYARVRTGLPIAAPEEMLLKGYGKRIALPRAMFGKKVMVSLFDVRGRLVERVTLTKAGAFVKPAMAEGIVVAKARVMQ
jgi:hypothetical protein